MKKFFFFFALLLVFSLKVLCQNPLPTPPPLVDNSDVIKISTTLIQVDVTVTDKKGNVVTDLKPEDFEIYENGKKQDITNFSFIFQDNKKEQNPTVKQQTPVKEKDAIPIPPLKLKPEQVRRTYALVVDDLGIAFENIAKVKQSLKKFVNEQMQEGDLVAIIRTGSGVGALQSFTTDKRQLLAAIEKIRWNSQGRSGISVIDAIKQGEKKPQLFGVNSDGTANQVSGTEEDKIFQEQIANFRNENFAVGTLGSLNHIIRGMNDLPGRKSLLLFSDGFTITETQEGRQIPNRIMDAIRALADLANRSSVVIYTLDPRGLQVVHALIPEDNLWDYGSSSGSFSVDGDEISKKLERRSDIFRESQESLRFLAYETGGIPFVNQNDLNIGMQQAVNDQKGYYLLGYEPDDETFDPRKNKFNKLEIKLNRPDLKVRYRSGFFGITDEKIRSTFEPNNPQQKLFNALNSPFGATEINLSLYPIYSNDAKNGDAISALVYIDTKDLKFSESTDDKRKANFDIVAMTFGDNGLPVDKLSKNYTIEVSEKVYQNMLKNGFVYKLFVPIKKAGAYQFRVALRDTASEMVGSASQFIEVPNVKKRMTLSNIVLDDFTPNEWQKIKLGGSRDDSERSVLLDTTLRQFKRGTILRYDYAIYDFKQTKEIETRMRLIKDGKVVYEEQPEPVKTEGQTDRTRIQSAGAFSLGKNLEPGDYILQIIVTDGKNEKKFATQFVEFEIVQ